MGLPARSMIVFEESKLHAGHVIQSDKLQAISNYKYFSPHSRERAYEHTAARGKHPVVSAGDLTTGE